MRPFGHRIEGNFRAPNSVCRKRNAFRLMTTYHHVGPRTRLDNVPLFLATPNGFLSALDEPIRSLAGRVLSGEVPAPLPTNPLLWVPPSEDRGLAVALEPSGESIMTVWDRVVELRLSLPLRLSSDGATVGCE